MGLFVLPMLRALDSNSDIMSGAKLYFYQSGTSTPQDVYTTSGLSVAHTNPVVADSGGLFAPIYLSPQLSYRAVLKNSNDVTVQDIDPVEDALSSTNGAGNVGYDTDQTYGAGTVGRELYKINQRTLGTMDSGVTVPLDQSTSYDGNADGTTVVYAHKNVTTLTGSNPANIVRAAYFGGEHNGTGLLNTLYGLHTYCWVKNTGNVANVRVNESHLVANSSGDITGTGYVYNVADVTLGTGTIGGTFGYNCGNIGHATLINSAIGFNCIDLTASAVLTVGFRSELNSASGKWGFLASGTANNAFVGNVRIGDATAPTEKLEVAGNINATGVVKIDGTQVLGNQGAAVADATDAATAITQLNAVLARLRAHGIIAT